MIFDSLSTCLTIVRVDLKSAVHTSLKALIGSLDALSSRVRSSVSNNAELVTVFGSTILDQSEVLIPVHEVTLTCGTRDDDSINTGRDLVLNQFLVSI